MTAEYASEENREIARQIHVATQKIYMQTFRSDNICRVFEGIKALNFYENYAKKYLHIRFTLSPSNKFVIKSVIRVIQKGDHFKSEYRKPDEWSDNKITTVDITLTKDKQQDIEKVIEL